MLYNETMTKVLIRREGGVTIEADLTFDQVKELAGVNGHNYRAPVSVSASPLESIRVPNFTTFMETLSERGRKFVVELKARPNGIDAYEFAKLLGYQEPRQIGGLTGGGIAKAAKTTGINLRYVYRTEIKFPEGKRTVMFYPGKLLLALPK